ncbi:MAG: peptidylprolyl isomerase [Coriobacteriia bacterium]|nr:peptidylprolyl isomerase [Coriobacteriia bacterium]
MPASTGDVVRVHYRGTLSDGSEFDSSEGRAPLEFKLGEGSVIDGFDAGVTGLEVGEKRTVTIPPEQAYGPKNETLVQRVEPDVFAEDPYVGGHLNLVAPDGGMLPGVITAVDEDGVEIDFNHPLAGQTLVFDIELVEIVAS